MTGLQQHLATNVRGTFAELVDDYGPMVLTLATRLTDSATGEDITQEVFLRAFRALDSYDEQRILGLDLRPWLATIARNLVRNEYRRRERRPTAPLEANQSQGSASSDDPGEIIAMFDSVDEVGKRLHTLSDSQREAVVLRHIVGLPMREVALTMACPIGTAKSHVSRGMAALRDLEPDYVSESEG